LFRALGNAEPPEEIEVDGRSFHRVEIYKHDSWAATALYECDARRIVCKFNRIQPIFGIWFGWLGRLLARRERTMYDRLHDFDNTPCGTGPIKVAGRVLPYAVGHEYIAGHPLRWHDRLDDEFFPTLRGLLNEVHRQGIAYVDLHKRENIIVGDDGRPYLIDFQISVKLPRLWPFSAILRILQKSDHYHLNKHVRNFRPDQLDPEYVKGFARRRPLWIRLHRMIGRPVRELRRWLLVRLGIRSGAGKAQTESWIEEGLRQDCRADTPLLRLHKTLVSDEYFHACGGTYETYVPAVFEKLFGRGPQSERDRKDVDSLIARRSRHQVVSTLLRRPDVFRRSNGLLPVWTESLNREIQAELRERETQDDPAATGRFLQRAA
jgi:hypothetical protein